MKILSIIMSILMIVCGFACMFTPVGTFLAMGYFFAVMFFVYGLMGIIRAFTKKDMSTIQIVMSVLALIVGIIAIIKPGSTLAMDAVILGFIAAGFLIEGASRIVMGWKMKGLNKNWIWIFLIGILGVVLGAYMLVHPAVAAVTAGFLIGFGFLQTGFNMLALALSMNKNDKE